MIHKLKTDPEVFNASYNGYKPFEIRKNDRDYKVNDVLVLQETVSTGAEMLNGAPLKYTGREMTVKVTYALYGPACGLMADWVIMSSEVMYYY